MAEWEENGSFCGHIPYDGGGKTNRPLRIQISEGGSFLVKPFDSGACALRPQSSCPAIPKNTWSNGKDSGPSDE